MAARRSPPARPAPTGAPARAASSPPPGAGSATPLVARTIERTMADQYAQAADEVRRLVEATYRVIEREGSVEPKVRDILAEAGLATQSFYRHFRSKDELLLVILDDGRRQLATYLGHRMEKAAAKGPVAEVTAWIEGMLAQAADPAAAARTRPFMVSHQRLAELHPAEQQASVDLLVDLLAAAVQRGRAAGELATPNARRSAVLVYRLTEAVMEAHLLAGTAPSRRDRAELVAFCLAALHATP